MPIRLYFCKTCYYEWQDLVKINDPMPSECPHCGQEEIGEKLSAPAISTGGKKLPEFNVGFNPNGKTQEEKFTVTERTASNAKEIKEMSFEASRNASKDSP